MLDALSLTSQLHLRPNPLTRFPAPSPSRPYSGRFRPAPSLETLVSQAGSHTTICSPMLHPSSSLEHPLCLHPPGFWTGLCSVCNRALAHRTRTQDHAPQHQARENSKN
ncbi:hypothetical protein BD779DRAFT_1580884 [Infundibulicybe gibba]|nr:hypothetical protein BD779DRAFT_1580884 [Infundibulicybe gibba]